MDSNYYKYCLVPQCKSTTIKTPEKLFIYVPRKAEIRKKWLILARRDVNVSSDSRMYFCEDHFYLPKDMVNFMEYHIMGSVSKIQLKPGSLPSKFDCQRDSRKRTRQCVLKKQKRMIIEECLNESDNNSGIPSTSGSSSVHEHPSRINPDLPMAKEDLQDACKTEDKSIQVLIRKKFRSKATQINIKYKDQAPLKSLQKSVSTSVRMIQANKPALMRYTPQERGIIVSIFLRNNSSVVLAQREFRRRFPGRPTPSGQTLRRLATNLEKYGTTRDVAKSGRPRNSRPAEDVELSLETSTRRRASQLAISRSSLRRILVKDLRIFPYKIQSPQSDQGLKRRRSSTDDTDTESLPSSPSASFVGKMNFETDAESEALSIKVEKIYDGDMVADPSAAPTDSTSGLTEDIIKIEEIKIEQKDDPLLTFSEDNDSRLKEVDIKIEEIKIEQNDDPLLTYNEANG